MEWQTWLILVGESVQQKIIGLKAFELDWEPFNFQRTSGPWTLICDMELGFLTIYFVETFWPSALAL